MIIWLSSFPKSGNTWLRSIVSSLVYSDDGIFNFSLNKKIRQFPSKEHLLDFTNDFNNIHEIKKYWVLAQEKLNLDNEIKFFKTHHLNCTIDNHPFTNKENTAGTIYIVRDPRNLVNSISNHFSKSIVEAKDFLFKANIIGAEKDDKFKGEVVKLIGSWKDHFNFWTKKNDNLLLIKYENIVLDPQKELDKIKNFLSKFIKFKFNDTKEKNIIESTSFDSLRKMEENGDFNENVFEKISNKKIRFFNKGPSNNWQDSLDKNIILEIEKNFNEEMKELRYIN
tara:strand:+ start:640 stop:1482 length:843 start_codon:yes stop_codon:yes gene_type:complete